MENPTQGNYISKGVIYINEPSVCFICKKTDLDTESKYCSACGFPQRGEQEEQRLFYKDHILKESQYAEALRSVKRAQNILYIASGLCVLSGLLLGALQPEAGGWTLAVGFILAFIFLGLGIWGKDNPLAASITGLVIYVTVLLVGIVFSFSEGNGRAFGFMDVIIIIFLSRGISGALKAERLKKEKGWDWRTNP